MLKNAFFMVGIVVYGISAAYAAESTAGYLSELKITGGTMRVETPRLARFVQQVWEQSPAIRKAQAGVDAAKARARAAENPLYNPEIDVEAERTDINTSTLGISQTIDWGDKKGARAGVAGQELQAALAELRETRQAVTTESLEALVQYAVEREQHRLAKQRSAVMKSFIDTVKQRQAAGDIQALDVALAQVAYSEALIQQASSASRLSESESALQAVSGIEATQWPTLPASLGVPPETSDVARVEFLPELLRLRSLVDAAKARVELAQRERTADPTFGVRVGKEDKESLIGVSVSVPLFVRNNFRAESQAAAHEVMVETEAYRDALRRAQARLYSAVNRFRNTTQAWRTWLDTGQNALREQSVLLESLWKAGELNATDYLVQAKLTLDAQVAAIDLAGDVWRAAIAWLNASGRIEEWLGLNAQAGNATNSGEQQ